jgi:hypothetical protein
MVYFTAIWYNLWPFGVILWPFGVILGRLVYFLVLWHIFTILVCLNQGLIWQPCDGGGNRLIKSGPINRKVRPAIEMVRDARKQERRKNEFSDKIQISILN